MTERHKEALAEEGAYRHWEPEDFKRLASLIHGEAAQEAQSADEGSSGQESAAIEPVDLAALADQVRAQAREEGYQAGLEAGRQEGFEVGQKAGRAHGFAEGRAEGLEQGRAEGAEAARVQVECLAALAASLGAQAERVEQDLANEVVALAIVIAEKVICRELAAHPEYVGDAVKAALKRIPQRRMVIHVHPEDLAVLKRSGDHEFMAALREDGNLARGDCLIESPEGHVDGRLHARWRRVLEGLGFEEVIR